jgi:hypothetical protein
MLIPNKFSGYAAGRRLYPVDSGGGDSAPASQTVTNDLPDWAIPYAQEVLGKSSALAQAPYQAYGGERQAQFTPLQQRAFQGAGALTPSNTTGQAAGIAGQAAQQALGTGYAAGQFQNQFQAPGQYDPGQFNAQNVQASQLQQFQMGPAERVSADSFTRAGAAQDYMSPYMQNVVGIQQREAQRAADIAGTQRGAAAVQSGAFGGSRQAIMDAEAARNLAMQKGDIQATGQQAAFQNAQQQFNAEQNARMQAALANQGAGLTVGQQNLGALLGIQQLGAGQSLQAQLANQQTGMTAQQLAEQSRQFGAGQGLTAAQAAAQYGQSAQQLGEQSRQYGAGLGLQGLQTALTGAGQMGALGGQQFGQQKDVLGIQNQFGTQQQQQVQNILGQQYEDFLAQKKFPYQQLEFQSNLLRGTPSGSTQTMYTAQPSAASQLVGAGTALYGASKMAKGGSVKSAKKKSAGLAELALSKI